jgi:uncharacterized repeat protein (TIGR03803 family)
MMKLSGRSDRVILTLAVLAAAVLCEATAHAQSKSYWVLYEFGQEKSDGWQPVGAPAVAKNGDLYGVTGGGGDYNSGTAFKLMSPKIRSGGWEKSVIYEFPGGDGGEGPTALMFGEGGNLYGADDGQSLFELSAPKSHNGTWEYHQLYALNGTTDGEGIQGIVLDAEGNIYGTTEEGGDLGDCEQHGCGTVFELKRPTKKGGKWGLSVLYAFTGEPDGALPFAGVTFDQSGNLYGTTFRGGDFDWGAVYELKKPTKKGQPWTESVLYSFDQSDNDIISPEGPVTFDTTGNMYGTTALGGDLNCQGGFGCGVVFELSPPAKKGKSWSYATLYAFQGGNDGIYPTGYMVFDSAGNLYGTTQTGGGKTSAGTVYRLSPPGGSGGAWTESVLHGFTGSNDDGALPVGLTWGKWSDLYGVTEGGGIGCQSGCGTAFEIRP